MKNLIKPIALGLGIALYSYPLFAQKPELVVQTGHTDFLSSMAFSPDGKILASGSLDNTIKLWDVETGKELRTFQTETSVVFFVFSPDGKILASSSENDTIKLWEVSTGKEISSLKAYWQITCGDFSPDGKILVTGGLGGTILWEVGTGKVLRVMKNSCEVLTTTFSPDGKILASGIRRLANLRPDSTIKIWDVVTGKELCSVTGHFTSVAFSPDGKLLACGRYGDKTVRIWQVQTGRELRVLEGHSSEVDIVAFSSKGRIIASGSDDTIKLWDLDTGKELCSLMVHSNVRSINSIAFSPDGKILASGSYKTIKLWDVATGKEIRILKGYSSEVNSVAFSSNGKMLASAGYHKKIKLWNVYTGKDFRVLRDSNYPFAFSPDGETLASGSWGKTIKLWEVGSGEELHTFRDSSYISSIAFSPDGKLLASGFDKTITLWDVSTGKKLRTLTGHSVFVESIAFSPKGEILASRSADYTVKLWEVDTGKELPTLHLSEHSAFSPDGKILASGRQLLDMTTGKEICAIKEAYGWSLDFFVLTPDGNILGSGSLRKTIKLWDIHTGNELYTFTGHSDIVNSVSLNPNGNILVSGSDDGKIKFWEVATGKELASLIALDENDWVVVTPDGRFDGSPDGLKKLHYVQNNQPIPLDAFFEQFYTPKLLARVLSGEAEPATHAKVDFSKAIKLPPLVKITSPKAGESFTTNAISITVEATDQGGDIDEIRLYQNDKLVSGEQRGILQVTPKSGYKITKTFRITLVPGMNEFRATAFNTDRTESNPDVILIELKAVQHEASLYLLAIGINEYKNSNYNLNYGRPDAQAFVQAVEERGKRIFKQVFKQELYDLQATREAIVAAFDKIIVAAKPQDVFVFFYAGHGVMSEGDDRTPPEFYLVSSDITKLYGDDALLAAKGLSAKQLKDFCIKIQAQKQLVIIDACQAGGAVETFAMRGAAEEKAIAQLARSAGVVVLASSGTEQFAAEFSKLGHGVFTYALLQGMTGDADGGASPDGKITVKELEAYLNDKVPELTKKYRGMTQYPNSYARGQDFPLGVVR